MRPRLMLRTLPPAVLALLALAGCTEQSARLASGPNFTTTTPPSGGKGTLTICKVGSSATFDITEDGVVTQQDVALADGECKVVSTLAAEAFATEDASADYTPDSIKLVSVWPFATTTEILTGTATAGGGIGDASRTATFYNTPTPPSFTGCTPGYWKTHLSNWPAPYTPSTQFSAVFDNAFPGMTLLQVMNLGGGGLNALGRHAVAGVLSAAAGINYPLTAQQVIDAFNAVYPGGDYNGLKNTLAAYNEANCPLN